MGEEAADLVGSSPRARGTDRTSGNGLGGFRFIPAGAGNGTRRDFWIPLSAVHPRGRGERLTMAPVSFLTRGSSPRARGTADDIEREIPRSRFIPAGAGNGSTLDTRSMPLPVHPRGRGERLAEAYPCPVEHGSSPRARGTERHQHAGRQWRRFIPAGAGNGLDVAAGRLKAAVHPRGRGERGRSQVTSLPAGGSSPRARGTARGQPPPPSRSPVHPRGRGERDRGLHRA